MPNVDVVATWDFTTFECVQLRVFANGIQIDQSITYCGSSSSQAGYVGPMDQEAGPWRVQLWSTTNTVELWSKTWDLAGLDIASTVTPTGGQIGTTFVAMSVVRPSTTGPDLYVGPGVFNVSDGSTSVLSSAALTLASPHYFTFTGAVMQDEWLQYQTSATFSYSGAGSHAITTTLDHPLGILAGEPQSITVSNQFAGLQSQVTTLQGQITALQGQVSDLEGKTATLEEAKAQLQNDLAAAENETASLQSELESARTMSLALGVVATALAVIGIALAIRKGKAVAAAPRGPIGPRPGT